METVKFKVKNLIHARDEALKKAKDSAPKTMKKLKIGLSREQVKKLAVKTLQGGGIFFVEPEKPPQQMKPRDFQRRSIIDDFNTNASALRPDVDRQMPPPAAARVAASMRPPAPRP